MSKIAVFYFLAQFDGWEEDYYVPQTELLRTSGLYENIDFIDINISNQKYPLPYNPDKIRNVTYRSEKLKEENGTIQSIWDFAQDNPGYKVLFFHTLGITWKNREATFYTNRMQTRKHLETCCIELWKECTELLDFYDTVGTNYIENCNFADGKYIFRSPHYPGNFWWANTNYLRTLDRKFFTQDVPWNRYLSELWIGSGNPRAIAIDQHRTNTYNNFIEFDAARIKENAANHIKQLKEQWI